MQGPYEIEIDGQKPRPATEKQAAFLRTLFAERETSPQPGFDFEVWLRTATTGVASATIEDLLGRPKKAGAQAAPAAGAFPEVPNGNYALRTEGAVKFYRVNVPTEGKWQGFTFVDAYASDERHPIRNRDAKREILTRIAADATGAMQLFGQELGRCGGGLVLEMPRKELRTLLAA